MLTPEIKEFIKKDAKKVYPKECCGLIVQENCILFPVSCKNTSATPEKSFIVDEQEVKKYNFDNIVGFYHSHKTDNRFSVADMAFSERLQKRCILYSVDQDIFEEYTPNGMEIPYEGRPFFIGIFDCFVLFKDYYRRELNIKFNDDIEHPTRLDVHFWKTKECAEKFGYIVAMPKYFESHGFIKVSSAKKHDAVLLHLPGIKFPMHIAIYLGENKILHHLKEFSSIDKYSGAVKRLTTHIYRHNSLI